ncbi:MAG: hypothetical protein ACREOO_17885 [bacterium]
MHIPFHRFFKTLQFWILLLILAGWFDQAPAQQSTMVAIDSLLQKAIVATIQQKYDRANAFIDTVIAHAPEEPIGYLFRAATLQSRMLDYENDADAAVFMKSLKTCRQLSEKMLHKNPSHAHAHFWLGSAYGYEAFYLGKKRRYIEAVHKGWKTIQHLETAVRLEPDLYDAYLGIGTYKYYRSKMKLFFLGDESAEGLAMVRQAATRGKYSRYAAINGLTWMLLDENLVAEAYSMTDSVLQQFPHSRFFLWGAAESAARLQEFERARECYRQIMDSLQEEQKLSPYLEAVCRTKLARLALRQEKPQEACAQLDFIDVQRLSRDAKGKEVAKQMENLRKSCMGIEAASNGRHSGQ